MKNKFNPYLQIIGFALVIFVLLFDLIMILAPDKSYSSTENRNLELRPELTVNSFLSGRYEEKYENYVEDQFPLRDLWIRLKTSTDRLTGKNESNGVYLSADGYLIQNFNEPDKENKEETFTAIAEFTARHSDLSHYAIVAPTAVTILEDKLPNNAPVGDQNAFIDDISTAFTSSGVTFIDLRGPLSNAAKEQQIYYKTDHHWTTPAAHLAYSAFAGEAGLSGKNTKYDQLLVSNSFKGTLSASSGFRMSETDEVYVYLPKKDSVEFMVSYDEENMKSMSFYNTEKLEVRDHYSMFLDGNHAKITISTMNKSNRTLLVLKDSYANCFIPFLVGDFYSIIVVDPRYYAGDIDELIKSEMVTDVLYLYNASTLAEDANLKTVIRDPAPAEEETEE